MDYEVLHKEGDLFTIFTSEEDKRVIGVHNNNYGILKTIFFNIKKNISVDKIRELGINGWSVCVSESFDDIMTCILYNSKVHYFKCVYDSSNNLSLKKLNHSINFDYNNPFIFFTGSGGGGTSIVVKLLRFMGVHFGDDCGDITNRKPHESLSIKVNLIELEKIKNLDINLHNFNLSWQLYNYKFDSVNCAKIPNLGERSIYLSNLFPNSKFVSVIRNQNNFYSTDEGKRFNEKNKSNLIDSQRPLVEGNPMFHLNFYKFFTEFQYVNKVLKFIGHDKFIESEQEFNDLKEKIDFDDRVLTNYFDK